MARGLTGEILLVFLLFVALYPGRTSGTSTAPDQAFAKCHRGAQPCNGANKGARGVFDVVNFCRARGKARHRNYRRRVSRRSSGLAAAHVRKSRIGRPSRSDRWILIPIFFIMVGVDFNLPALFSSSEALASVPLLLRRRGCGKNSRGSRVSAQPLLARSPGSRRLLCPRLSLIIAAATPKKTRCHR